MWGNFFHKFHPDFGVVCSRAPFADVVQQRGDDQQIGS